MSHSATRKYGEMRWNESLGMVLKLIPLPAWLLWKVVSTSFASFNQDRSVKRIVGDSALRYLVANMSLPQLQATFGTDARTYQKWAKKNNVPMTIDELGEDSRLLWIGPKPERLERVVLFSHGGGFLLSTAPYSLAFWRYVQLELAKQNLDVGFALFTYSLGPVATFPTPLKQARLALEFLLAAGVKPQNLQLVGDSAGGNLILQVLSQMLHPRDGVPEIHLSAPLRGAYLISPWVSLNTESKSHTENDGLDFLTKQTLGEWGREVLSGVPEADRAFVDVVRAPEWWFKGVDRLVDRVLITAGAAEILRDDIVVFGEAFKKHHANTELVVQKNGLHEDMYLDFVFKEDKVGSLTPLSVEWLAAGFTAEPVPES
ncbi:Alpha/Beta hydrolase protein [Mycena crocata]|nr:Alpha/Beta hydrolase protein [Mycena crocata]